VLFRSAQTLADELMREFSRARITVDTESPPEHEDAYLWVELDGTDTDELRELWQLAVVGCQRLREERDVLVAVRLRRGPSDSEEGEEPAYWQR
jgi:hypothetical protein